MTLQPQFIAFCKFSAAAARRSVKRHFYAHAGDTKQRNLYLQKQSFGGLDSNAAAASSKDLISRSKGSFIDFDQCIHR